MKKLFTSESVTEGHPDKICDQISDAVLDSLLSQDPMSRVACEVACTTGLVLVMGEITSKGYADIPAIVRNTVRRIGYDRAKFGFDADTCGIISSIHEQSADIARGVDNALETPPTPTDLRSGQGIRDSCSVTPAAKRRSLCLCRSRLLTRRQRA